MKKLFIALATVGLMLMSGGVAQAHGSINWNRTYVSVTSDGYVYGHGGTSFSEGHYQNVAIVTFQRRCGGCSDWTTLDNPWKTVNYSTDIASGFSQYSYVYDCHKDYRTKFESYVVSADNYVHLSGTYYATKQSTC